MATAASALPATPPRHLSITSTERAKLTDSGSLIFVGGDLVWDACGLEWVTVEVVA